jgi:Terminase RNaseH-like domain/Homeodomain-like domain
MTTKTRISPQRRLKAARLVRQGTPVAAVERETGISKRTLWRWLQDDDDFLTLVHGAGTIQVGPVRLAADHDAPQLEDLPDDSLLWIDRQAEEVIGSVHVDDARFLRAVFPSDPQRTREELAAGRIPYDEDAATFTLRADALPELADADNVSVLCRLCSPDARIAFRTWLSLWRFRSGEDKTVRILGETLWDGQRELAETVATTDFTFLLKARKLGQSTLCVAYAAFCARVRDEQARVHLYSYRERAAIRLLEQVKFGLDRLPVFLRLPLERETRQELVYAAGADDERTIVSYPMSKNTSIEETSTHAMLDEFAFWPDCETTFARLEPTFTAPGATATLVTTGNGPANFSTTLWRQCKDGDGIFEPVFLPATARPGRDGGWLERKRRSMSASAFRSEYALTEADALAGPAEREFSSDDIAACIRYPRYGPNSRTEWPLGKAQRAFPRHTRKEPERLCRYIIGVDVGKKDATVITALDVTSDTFHVAGYWRYVGLTYPTIQSHIMRVAHEYPGAPVVIEANAMGQAVIENISIPNRVIPFFTSATSKARAIEQLARKLQHWELQFDARELTQLHNELAGYTLPDDYVVQDSVMSLAIAIDQAPEAYSAKNQPGRLMSVLYV